MRVRPATTLLLTATLTAGMAYYYFGIFLPCSQAVMASWDLGGGYEFAGDVYPIWLTGRELIHHHTNPYTPSMTARIQAGLYGRPLDPHRGTDPLPNYRAFSYPLYTDVLLVPLLPLSFPMVRLLLALLLPLLTGVSLVLWSKAVGVPLSRIGTVIALAMTLLSYPVLEGLYAEQPAMLVGFLLAGGIFAITRGSYRTGGVLVALASIKPQVSGPVTAWLILWTVIDWKQRKNFVIGLVASLAFLLAASQFLLPGWHRYWYHALVDYRAYTLPPLAEYVLGKFPGHVVELVLLLVTVIMAARALQSRPDNTTFNLALCVLLIATVIVLPTGGAVYDQVVTLPAFLWLWGQRATILSSGRSVRLLALLLIFVLSWQWITATLVAVAALASLSWARSTPALLLPVRMASSLPFVLFAVLALIGIRHRARIPAHVDV